VQKNTAIKLDLSPQPTVAVVLGNQHLTSLAAVALFDFLDKHGIAIKAIISCGGGSLASSMRGMGLSTAEMLDAIQRLTHVPHYNSLDYRTLFSMLPFQPFQFQTPASVFKPTQLQQAFHEIFGEKTTAECSPKLYFQATNIYDATGVLLSEGKLKEVVYASTAAFPMHPPICIDGQWLVNGSFSQALPLWNAVKAVNADIFIALNVEQFFGMHEPYPYFLTSFFDAVYAQIEKPQHLVAIDQHHHAIVFIPMRIEKEISFHNLSKRGCKRIMSEATVKINERAEDIFEAFITSRKKT
jgi:NTE family protein